MSRSKVFLLLMLLCLTAGQLAAQTGAAGNPTGGSTLFTQPKGFLDALFNPSRFSMSHSYTMSVGSYGSQSYNQGLYLNTMRFQLADPLFMQMRIGYAHQPLGGNSFLGQSEKAGQFFLQQLYMEYKPFNNTKLNF